MNTDQLYKDIHARTGGEIYLGVVGPVRTGKSTFIKRFMDVMVLPQIEDEHGKTRARDELPQSASGKTIMTTEPKFVPKDAAEICLPGDAKVKVRLIDCVGYMVDGASGHIEGGEERQVKTPWFDHEILQETVTVRRKKRRSRNCRRSGNPLWCWSIPESLMQKRQRKQWKRSGKNTR